MRLRALAVCAVLAGVLADYSSHQVADAGPVAAGRVPAAYTADINRAGRTCPQISTAILAAQIHQESGFNPRAVSPAGAEGIAQFEPATARAMGVDPFDPHAAIAAMARLDCSEARRFGSLDDALAAYNAGPGPVEAGTWRGITQTRDYVADITAAAPGYEKGAT